MSEHTIITEKEKQKLYNQEMPLICECKDVTFEELLIENPSIYQDKYQDVISPKELLEKWKELQKLKQR
tara:strand:+ start:31293 stop:31499 length:207 start_codon:yes stop_codon:yes gene_type:complete